MIQNKLLLLLIDLQLLIGCTVKNQKQTLSKAIQKDFKIAFGLCASENNESPIFYEVVKHKSDLFIL